MATVLRAEGAVIQRWVSASPATMFGDLTDTTFLNYHAALANTGWAVRHRQQFALVRDDEVMSLATRYGLAGMVDEQPVAVCAITQEADGSDPDGSDPGATLVAHLVDEARHEGVDVALWVRTPGARAAAPDGFEALPVVDVELAVEKPRRYGAPMVLVRAGEDRDMNAIAAMGRVRASGYRFFLEREPDHIRHVIAAKRLRAGLAPRGARQLEFFIIEEGITAAAYVVMTVEGKAWTIEECGDRDPSGARLGALLQALIARYPSESPPTIRGWLPPGWLPPQVTATTSSPSALQVLSLALSPRAQRLNVPTPPVLYWRSDVF